MVGPEGQEGIPGMDGNPGKDGSKAMPVRQNKTTFYLHSSKIMLTLLCCSSSFGCVINDYLKNVLMMYIQGEQGDDGETGLPGKAGSRGKTGIPGLPGEQGTIGPKVKGT